MELGGTTDQSVWGACRKGPQKASIPSPFQLLIPNPVSGPLNQSSPCRLPVTVGMPTSWPPFPITRQHLSRRPPLQLQLSSHSTLVPDISLLTSPSTLVPDISLLPTPSSGHETWQLTPPSPLLPTQHIPRKPRRDQSALSTLTPFPDTLPSFANL